MYCPKGRGLTLYGVSHFFRCVVGGPRSGSSALQVAGSSVPGKYKITKIEVQTKEGPPYPANEGAKISGEHISISYPVRSHLHIHILHIHWAADQW